MLFSAISYTKRRELLLAALPWFCAEVLLVLPGNILELFRIDWRFTLDGDVWPFGSELLVKPKPLFQIGVRVRFDGVDRALRLTHATIDAFVRMDHQHVFPFVEAIHGANFYTVHQFAFDAGVGDDIGHGGKSTFQDLFGKGYASRMQARRVALRALGNNPYFIALQRHSSKCLFLRADIALRSRLSGRRSGLGLSAIAASAESGLGGGGVRSS